MRSTPVTSKVLLVWSSTKWQAGRTKLTLQLSGTPSPSVSVGGSCEGVPHWEISVDALRTTPGVRLKESQRIIEDPACGTRRNVGAPAVVFITSCAVSDAMELSICVATLSPIVCRTSGVTCNGAVLSLHAASVSAPSASTPARARERREIGMGNWGGGR